jgi:uncharacterized protein YjiK
MRPGAFLLLLLAAACSAAPPDPPAPAPDQRDLPPSLREVSGLAEASPGSVFAHDDERAVVHEIELASGRTLRRFSLGDPPARGDFEGIAADRDHVYLIASDGRLLAAPIGEDGATVSFETYDTGVGAACEIEGLSLAPEPRRLLILCKRARHGPAGRLVIYEWDMVTHGPAERPWRDIDVRALLGEAYAEFAPSSIEWVPSQRQLVVVSARDRMLLALDENGGVVGTDRLDAARHPQPEGVTVTASGQVVIADEGPRGRPGRLTVYPPDYLRQVLSRFAATASGPATSSKNPAR